MSKTRVKILTIAGFDPSGGAGILADIKTFEANGCLGFAVCTANTIQNEFEFVKVNWVEENEVLDQLAVILKLHQFKYVKIGLIPSLSFLKKVTSMLTSHNSSLNIVWDPILSASAGFNFNHSLSNLKEVLKEVFLVTPNWEEVKQLSANNDALQGAKELSALAKVYLKGGHNDAQPGVDYLWVEGQQNKFNPKAKRPIFAKHGSGCILSSSLTVNLAKGYPLIKACLRSKRYVEKALSSNSSLLAYHSL